MDKRRALPSVDRLLRSPSVGQLAEQVPRPSLVGAIRALLTELRSHAEQAPADPDDPAWSVLLSERIQLEARPTLRRVINATGVVLHTNLGRAPLADLAVDAVVEAAHSYSTLEYDVEKGARGSRHVHCAALLASLTGAQAALVVNNAASALMLVLAVAAEGGDTIVSRGELIEIGGGFRIPEIMERSGTHLVEVGTTNRTRISDYEKALLKTTRGRGDARTRGRALLKVHRSNFRVEGFTAEASLEELVALGNKKKVPVLYDLGSGLMADLGVPELVGEPALPAAVKSGVTAVVASGDKLLGGPQAGLIAGKAKFIAACLAHPFARATRADKLTLAALSTTLQIYKDGGAHEDIPILRMLTTAVPVLDKRAHALRDALPAAANASVVKTRTAVGGGSFPGVELESRGIALEPLGIGATDLAARLRHVRVPVVGVVQKGRVILDVRTLLGDDEIGIVAAVTRVLA